MLKHAHYPQTRRSFDDGSNRSSGCSTGNSSVSDNCSSRSSSALSVTDSQMGTIKVYCGILRPDVDYKTLFVSSEDSSKDIILMLLKKCKMRNRDPHLYYLSMDISTQRHSGQLLETTLVLDDDSQPLELKTCQPNGYSVRFTMRCRNGGCLKVHDSCLNPNNRYKSLLISHRTSAADVVRLLLSCYDSIETPENFALFEVCHKPHYNERKLLSQEMPLLVREKCPLSDENYEIHLRRLPLSENYEQSQPSSECSLQSLWPFKSHSSSHVFDLTKAEPNFLQAALRDACSPISCQNYMNYVYI